MEIATDADLLHLDFSGTEALGRAHDCMVVRLIEIFHVVRIEAHLGSKELRVEDRVFVARRAIEPCEVAVGERREVIHGGTWFRSLKRLRYIHMVLLGSSGSGFLG